MQNENLKNNEAIEWVEETIGYHLIFTSSLIQKKANREYFQKLGLTYTEAVMINTYAFYPGTPAQKAIDVSGIDKSGISRSLKSLESKGYLEIVKEPENGSKFKIFLTEKGHIMNKTINEIRLAANDKFLKGINEKHKNTIIEALKIIQKNIQADNV